MRKKVLIAVLVAIFTICLVACGGSSSSTSSAESESKGLFSANGGWKAEEGIIILLETDGSGAMLSEVKFEGDTSNLSLPSVFKTDITWEEDEETVSIKAEDTSYSLQKKKEGETESLELGDIKYVRLTDDELKEYQEKAASASSMDPNSTEDTSEANDDSGNEELVLDEPITVIDNEKVSVKFIRFFSEVMNKGTNSEWVNAGFDVDVENKMDEYEISLFPRDCSLSDRRVIEFAASGNYSVGAGKIATLTFTRLDQKAFDDLNALYELEGTFDLTVRDDQYSYSDLGGKLDFSIPKSINAGEIAEAGSANREAFKEVFEMISAETWVFNGGEDTILNHITFKEDTAAVGQVYFDGNGIHDNGVNECPYEIDNDSIIITLDDGGELDIQYAVSDDSIILGEGDYFTLSQVDDGLQGYWKYSYDSFGKKEGYLLVDHGTLKSESASTASGGAPGDYYYYGPYEGSYTLGIGFFETDLFKGSNWYFNIIDGVPTVLYYEHVCVPADGFAGENGYSF